MDALSKILQSIRLRGVIYRKFQVRAPWGIDLPKSRSLQFWKLLEGTCYLEVEEAICIHLSKGDLVLIPNGSNHCISDKSDSIRIPLKTFIEFRDSENPYFLNGDLKTVMLGGHFDFDEHYQHPLITGLPGIIHLKGVHIQDEDWLELTTNQILSEIDQPKPGSDILVSRLSEGLLIHTLRAYLDHSTIKQGFLLALTDKRISSALQNLQNSPEQNWTLEKLSKSAGLSRTLFFNRFKSLVGQTPLTYLQNWRMQMAKDLLLTSKDNVINIANQVGYQSEAAFNRLFKHTFKETPASFRRNHSAGIRDLTSSPQSES
ncbi:MAG: AraC family transcriptional regulator [Chryseobacterium sp.]|nr:MAG: AraC family transcriptional regulator [Chryseobacterium sp.]